MRTSVRFEEKFQTIVWRHNQSFTNQLGAVYARASSMFDLFILDFYFAVIYHSSIYVFSSLSFDTSAIGSGFWVCTLRMRFM